MLTLRQNRSDPRRLLLALSDFYLLVELGIVIGTESLGDICDSVKNNQPLWERVGKTTSRTCSRSSSAPTTE